MAKRDYYDVLGVDKSASDAEIKSAFRKLAKKYHQTLIKNLMPLKNLKKSKKLMMYLEMNKKERHMTNMVLLHLNKVQEVIHMVNMEDLIHQDLALKILI